MSSSSSQSLGTVHSPAQLLTGESLGEWIVGERVAKAQQATGGCFSVTYYAKNSRSGQVGFVKAVDLMDKLSDPDALRVELNNYKYEEHVLKLCGSLRMDGIVTALDSGIYKVKIAGGAFEVAVPYLVFETAKGDLRTHEGASNYDLSWRLRIFHAVCVAMNQLHSAEIAHQDLKPSNVLVFDANKAKIADLGRATIKSEPSSFDGFGHQGDNNYIPVELLYDGFHTISWARRRLGADYFMIGCLLVYLLADVSLLTLLMERLDKRFWPKPGGLTLEAALPHLEMAFDSVLMDLRKELPETIADELLNTIAIFSQPNPERRGRGFLHGDKWKEIRDTDPEKYIREQYSLETTISRMDVLATKAKKGVSLNKAPFLDFFRKAR